TRRPVLSSQEQLCSWETKRHAQINPPLQDLHAVGEDLPQDPSVPLASAARTATEFRRTTPAAAGHGSIPANGKVGTVDPVTSRHLREPRLAVSSSQNATKERETMNNLCNPDWWLQRACRGFAVIMCILAVRELVARSAFGPLLLVC